jgi:hypothetical protein
MYLHKIISRNFFTKISFLLASLRLMTKIEGFGSINQRNGSADPDPDPHQNDMDPQHWYVGIVGTCVPLENKLQLLGQVPHNTATLFTALGSISRHRRRCRRCSLLLPPLNGGVQGRLQR